MVDRPCERKMYSCPLLLLVAGSLAVGDRWVCDTFSAMNSCYSWQNRIVDMKSHGSVLRNSTRWCTDAAEMAGLSPTYAGVLPVTSRTTAPSTPWPHSVFVYRLELSAKHFAEFPFLLLLCNLSPPWPFSFVWNWLLFWPFHPREGVVTTEGCLKYEEKHHRD